MSVCSIYKKNCLHILLQLPILRTYFQNVTQLIELTDSFRKNSPEVVYCKYHIKRLSITTFLIIDDDVGLTGAVLHAHLS